MLKNQPTARLDLPTTPEQCDVLSELLKAAHTDVLICIDTSMNQKYLSIKTVRTMLASIEELRNRLLETIK